MGSSTGPKIARSGLVAYYDASNERSFRGLTATNLMYGIFNQLGSTNLFKTSYGTESIYIPYFSQNITVRYVDIYNEYNGGGNGNNICCPNPFGFHNINVTNISVTGSTTYMYQIIFKTDSGYYHPNYMYRYEFNSGGTILTEAGLVSASRLESLGDGWFHAWGSFTTNANTTSMTAWLFHYEYNAWNRIRVAAVCLTQGTTIHRPEHFINMGYRTTRGTTVATGGGWKDLIGSNDAELVNGVSYNGDFGGSLVFDGVNDYLQVASANQGPLSSIGTGDFTFFFWASNTGSSNYRWLISNWATTGVHFGMNSTSSRFGGYIGNSEEIQTDYSIPSDASWHCYVLTRTSGTLRFYVDAVERTIVSGTATKTGSVSAPTDTRIGSRGDSVAQFWLGSISLSMIYNRALSASDILALYNSTRARFLQTTTRNLVLNRRTLTSVADGIFNSLALHYDFANKNCLTSGSQFVYDLSPNRRNGIMYINGGTTFYLNAPGAITSSTEGRGTLQFDGTNDWIRLENNMTISSNVTVSAWVRLSASGDRGIYSHCSGGPVAIGYSIETVMKYVYYTNTWNTSTGYVTINDGIWKNVVWVKTGTNMKMYVNGILDRELTLVGDVSASMRTIGSLWGPCNSNNGTIGGSGYGVGTDSYGSVFNGLMGVFSVWSRALSAAEVTNQWNSYRTRYGLQNIVTSGLVLHLNASDRASYSGSGTTWTDLSGNGYNGTLTNGPTFETTRGGSIIFDGVDDFVSLPINSAFNTPSVTYEVWANLQTINDRHILLVNWSGNAIEVNSNRSVVMYSFSSGGQLGALTSAGVFEWDTWCHFLGTYDTNSQTLRTYVNGVLLATATNISSTIYNVSVHKISGTDYGGEVKGRVAAVRHYNRALSAAEVLQNFNAERWRFGI